MQNNIRKFVLGIFALIFLIYMLNKFNSFSHLMTITKVKIEQFKSPNIDLSTIRVRDFMFYNCSNIVRIGGLSNYVKNAPNKLWRIDGAWYICLDSDLKPKKSDCNVISLGINNDYSFDQDMRTLYDCNLHSYDPFVEAGFFGNIRNKNANLKNSAVLKVEDKWVFYCCTIK